MSQLWEILIPTVRPDGRPIRTRFHKVWDEKIRAISGGLTIMPVAKGQWVHQDQLFDERMIPVRIIATRIQMDKIIELTMTYYNQLAVLAYKISNEVILKKREVPQPVTRIRKGKIVRRYIRPTYQLEDNDLECS
jgi:hypothetical protein